MEYKNTRRREGVVCVCVVDMPSNGPFERCNNRDDNGYLSRTPPAIVSTRRFIVAFPSHGVRVRAFFHCQHFVYFAAGSYQIDVCLISKLSRNLVSVRFYFLFANRFGFFCLSDVLLTSLLVRNIF